MNSEWAEPPKKDQGGTSLAPPGAQLAAQREAMGLSVEHIADQLKLAPRQVVALEAGDYASLPNMAVVRGFVRAYAKVVKLDPVPLVAMIAVISPTSPEAAPLRKERAPQFSESRFPLMTDRSSGRGVWMAAAAVIVAALVGGGVYAYHSGMISSLLLHRAATPGASTSASTSSTSAVTELPKPVGSTAPLETTLVKPGQETTTLQSPNVPLISVTPPGGSAAPAPGAATTASGNAPATTPPATTPSAAAGATAAPAAPSATGTQLVLEVTADSWVEIRRPGAKPLVSRVIKAGSTETFDIKDPATLVVGKPDGVKATLGGAPLALPGAAGGTVARVNIK